jgi:HAMP domain-containing protein
MKLLVRINLALIIALGSLTVLLGYACWSRVQLNSQHEVMQQAGLMLDSAQAIRIYTSTEILPLLDSRMHNEFLPQGVPFYAATQNFLKLREQHPEYSYKEAALNPTNPRDRATDWEADLIQQFRNHPDTHQISGERETPTGRSLYLARPIAVETECLSCHSTPAAAPQALVARYGADNGFGWQEHEITGAHVVSVPLASAEAAASHLFRSLLTWIIVSFMLTIALVNAIIWLLVVRPVQQIAGVADELSTGQVAAGTFPTTGSPEILALVRSFERMRISLGKAFRLLER